MELAKLNILDNTIFCVVGDHGEAFGEHGMLGHDRIAFEEVLRVPWVIRARLVVEPGTKVTRPVSSIDFAPTLLALMGFDIHSAHFDGLNALGTIPSGRKVYFSGGWVPQSPVGFVEANHKFVYNPTNKMVSAYDLSTDPSESIALELPEQEAQDFIKRISDWRKNTIFGLNQTQSGKIMLFDSWLCTWNNRDCQAQYRPKSRE